jgi:lipopolysaccharide biosynthesis protein
MTTAKARAVEFYLPQFHPMPENDVWWSKGFTEWTNSAKARETFRGQYQPHVPADLVFYDLRVPKTRKQQTELARSFGIEAFCYYHYWFAGQRIPKRPFDGVLASGQPDFSFYLGWANETWTDIWHGAPKRILIEQTHPGPKDHEQHLQSLLPAFRDQRHLRVGGVPGFVVYKPYEVCEPRAFIDQWQAMAGQADLGGLHIVGFEANVVGSELIAMSYDSVIKAPLTKRGT